jgi:cytochrome c oxidase cbb3-type subunit 1
MVCGPLADHCLGRLSAGLPGTLWKRKEPHIYVANWFYLAFIVTIAMLHVVNNLAMPVSSIIGSKSYSPVRRGAGRADAVVVWPQRGGLLPDRRLPGDHVLLHPQAGERPVYSYRLSIIHFWALIFIYIWAGPHHLHYTALPEWAQTLGMTFSIMLWMPSWGGMINGLMTLSGAWDKLRTDPVIRMMVVSVAFYGMSTFEGPVMSIRAVNSLSHYTDWTIGHVHSGALGWVGFISFGAIYCLVPWLWKRAGMYSKALIEWHFWIATIGILLYITSMWVSGIMQGLMWRAYDSWASWSTASSRPSRRCIPTTSSAAGRRAVPRSAPLLMAWNVYKTIKGDVREKDASGEPAIRRHPAGRIRGRIMAEKTNPIWAGTRRFLRRTPSC